MTINKTCLNIIISLPKLMRINVSIIVSFSAVVACLLAKPTLNFELIHLAVAVFLLSGGASALNQVQEYKLDVLMTRTRNRPIPAKRISPQTGLLISMVLLTTGLLISYLKLGVVATILGLLNIVWYNAFYTHLKRIAIFAVVPGAFTGVIPLLIGWSSVSTNLLNPMLITVAFFVYVWQIPHFLLLQIKYINDYQKAGFGNFQQIFSTKQIKRIVFSWIISTILASLLFSYFRLLTNTYLVSTLIIANIALIVLFYRIVFPKHNFSYKKAFITINVFMIFILGLLIIERFSQIQTL